MNLSSGGVRRACLLEKYISQNEDWNPPSFVAFEVHLPKEKWPALLELSKVQGTSLVFPAASNQGVHPRPAHSSRRPWPTIPIHIALTHRTLQVLYFCAPGEASSLGLRLWLMARERLGQVAVTPCPPGVMESLLQSYVRLDSTTEALRDPQSPQLILSEAAPWSKERILLGRPTELLQRNPVTPSEVEDPVVLCPVALYMDEHTVPERMIALFLSRPGFLTRLLHKSGYSSLHSSLSNRVVRVLLPMRQSCATQTLVFLRDDLGQALRTPLGYLPVFQNELYYLVLQMQGKGTPGPSQGTQKPVSTSDGQALHELYLQIAGVFDLSLRRSGGLHETETTTIL